MATLNLINVINQITISKTKRKENKRYRHISRYIIYNRYIETLEYMHNYMRNPYKLYINFVVLDVFLKPILKTLNMKQSLKCFFPQRVS